MGMYFLQGFSICLVQDKELHRLSTVRGLYLFPVQLARLNTEAPANYFTRATSHLRAALARKFFWNTLPMPNVLTPWWRLAPFASPPKILATVASCFAPQTSGEAGKGTKGKILKCIFSSSYCISVRSLSGFRGNATWNSMWFWNKENVR